MPESDFILIAALPLTRSCGSASPSTSGPTIQEQLDTAGLNHP